MECPFCCTELKPHAIVCPCCGAQKRRGPTREENAHYGPLNAVCGGLLGLFITLGIQGNYADAFWANVVKTTGFSWVTLKLLLLLPIPAGIAAGFIYGEVKLTKSHLAKAERWFR